MTREEIYELASKLSAEESMTFLAAIENYQRWAVRAITRQDADSYFEGLSDRKLTDEEWGELTSTRTWKDLGYMDSQDWDALYDIMHEQFGPANGEE